MQASSGIFRSLQAEGVSIPQPLKVSENPAMNVNINVFLIDDMVTLQFMLR